MIFNSNNKTKSEISDEALDDDEDIQTSDNDELLDKDETLGKEGNRKKKSEERSFQNIC